MSDIAYARAGETHVAYRVIGDAGRTDIVMMAGALFPFELLAEDRVASRFVAGLAALGRVLVFDKRGVGLSDPMTDWTRTVQLQWAEDLLAVVDDAGFQRPVLVSWEAYGAARFAAAAYPGRFASLVLVNPAQHTRDFRELLTASGRTLPTRSTEEIAFPSRIHDEDFTAWLARAGRAGASPTTAARIWEHLLAVEEPLTPPGITLPTIVLHNRDSFLPVAEVQAVVDGIDGARLVQVAGADGFPIAGDVDLLTAEIAEFVTGAPSRLTPLRHVSAVLFTDLVDSTRRAVDVGDAQWRGLLDEHDRTVERGVRERGGRVVKYTGDGVLALLPSATAALEAAEAIRAQLSVQGLRIRAGIHVGDVDVRGQDVSGVAVNIAARIMGRATADETLVSEAARQAALGSGHRFAPVGATELKGIPGEWSLYRRVDDGSVAGG